MKKKLIFIVLTIFFLVACENQEEKDFNKEVKAYYKKDDFVTGNKNFEEFKRQNPDSKLINKMENVLKAKFDKKVEEIKEAFSKKDLYTVSSKLTELNKNFPYFEEEIKELEKLKAEIIYDDLMNLKDYMPLSTFKNKMDFLLSEFPNYDKERVEKLNERLKFFKTKELKKEKLEKKNRDKIKKEREENTSKIKSVIKKFHRKYDDFQDTTWINSIYINYFNNLHIYGGFKGKKYNGHMWYRLRFQYRGDWWAFFDKVIIITDSNRYEYSFDSRERETEVSDDVFEWYDEPLNQEYKKMIKDILKSKRVKLRFIGEKTRDFTLSNGDRKRLKAIMNLMELEEKYH